MAKEHVNRGQASRRVSSAGGTRCTDMLRALELEDLDKVPRAILREEGPRRQLSRVDIVYAYYMNKQLGRKIQTTFFDLKREVNSLQGRIQSFPASWKLSRKEDLALAGLTFDVSTETFLCVVCGITFRDLTNPEGCPFEGHKELVPYCVQLARYNVPDKPMHAAKRRRVCSTSAVMDMAKSY